MKKHLKLTSLVLVAGLMVTSILTGCSSSSTNSSSNAAKTLTIGVDLPLTGPYSKVGMEFKDACQMAFDQVGDKIGDYQVKLVWIDDQSDPVKGVAAYEQAIQRDHIQVGMLNWNSSVAVALMDVVAKYQIPHFFPLGGADTINQKWLSNPKYHYWITKGWAESSKMTVAYTDTIQNAIKNGDFKPRNQKMAIYGEQTDWATSLGKSLADEFKAAGWDVVDQQYFKLGETDFNSILTKFKSEDVSLIAGTIGSPPSMAAFLKQAQDQKLQSLIIADALSENADMYSLTGSASDYVLDNRPLFVTDKAQKFEADFKAKYGFDPSAAAGGQVYDYTNFFIQVANDCLKQNGELTSANLYKFAQDKLFTGQEKYTNGILFKSIEYDQKSLPDPVVGEGKYIFPVFQYSSGKPQVVWPDDLKQAPLKVKN
ncbi:ABC transporter substrate-binding protein [Desulfosporosinus sp. PR]|uniref:ABC transporter substrate-binding protein n=1 Tax=Candidatus Desulfosporosinus nitrosoreducens TaxID=3401928 RepID=UPI0028004196|nr:ABC transporter substrate-binding protein [Desulfosporosinus sp. PR]MDQ7095135.1 ABC transporter substrate-binding protein [Desulfosporosinus sp. PR]